jgi:hypothetical protein
MEGTDGPDLAGAAEMLLETVTPRRPVPPPARVPDLASLEVGQTFVGPNFFGPTFFGKPKKFFNKKDNAANFAVQKVALSVGVASASPRPFQFIQAPSAPRPFKSFSNFSPVVSTITTPTSAPAPATDPLHRLQALAEGLRAVPVALSTAPTRVTHKYSSTCNLP